MQLKYLFSVASQICSNLLLQAGDPRPRKQQPSARPKNIVFILSDDHRYDYMGFLKRIPWLETSNMDRRMAEGAYVRNALYDWLESTDGMNIPLKRTERPHLDHRNAGTF